MQLLPEGPGTHVGSDDAINRQGHLSDWINESDDQGEVMVIKVGGFFFFFYIDGFSSVQFSHSVVSNSATPWTAAHQASLSITSSWSRWFRMA